MFHCHNAVHEDRGMMGIFNVTKLADLNYKELEIDLEDPMDPRFRAKKYTGTNLDEIKSKTLPFFASLNAYPDPAKLGEVEDRYWSTRTPPSGDPTGPDVKGGGMGGMMGGGMGAQPAKPDLNSPLVGSQPAPKAPDNASDPPPPATTSSPMIGTGTGGINGNGVMGSGTMNGAGMPGSGTTGAEGTMAGTDTPGGATGCTPHNSHHGGCRRH